MSDNSIDLELMRRIRRDDSSAFSLLFARYYNDLLLYCYSFIRSREESEDIVQTVFLKLWDERGTVYIDKSVRQYLLRAVRNDCYDLIRHRKIKDSYSTYICQSAKASIWDSEHYIFLSDCEGLLARGLALMDEKAREAFCLNRFENLKYREIASLLNVSVRTVEVRISKALNFLKNYIMQHYEN